MSDRYDKIAKKLLVGHTDWPPHDMLAAALRRVAEEEREACAKIASRVANDPETSKFMAGAAGFACEEIETKIRARGKP